MISDKLNEIKAIIDEAGIMKGAYFFTPPLNASSRRSYERYHSHDEVKWEENEHTFTAEFKVKCSCANVYASGLYTRDGKKTTLTAIKNSYNRMMA